MTQVRAYLLSICGAAFVCAVLDGFWSRKSYGAMGRMMSGLFLALTVLQPLAKLDYDFDTNFVNIWEQQSEQAIALGKEESISAISKIIKEETASYILQRAQSLQVEIAIGVELSKGDFPVPEKVYIRGNIAPYAKQQLQHIIENDLGISKENQVWTSEN